MAESDYLLKYHQFFEEFCNSKNANDPLPLRVASFSINEDELLGQVIDCCIQYLYLINCPSSLQSHLSKLVVNEAYGDLKKTPLAGTAAYEPLKIMQCVTKTVLEICRRYLDNETLSKLPPPPSDPCVSSMGIRHTRRKMEDKSVHISRLNSLYNVTSPHDAAYYAIFDGHNGVDAANYAVSHVHQYLVESSHYPHDPVQAFKEAYAKTEEKFRAKEGRGGSTALAILHEPDQLVVSWLGDSQAMLIRKGRPLMLVSPHRPDRPEEEARISKAGGFVVEVDGIFRVNGDLAVSRAFGDFLYKPLISAEPEVVKVPLDGTEEVLILGCDGFWDVLTPELVCETFQFHVQNEPDKLNLLSNRLVDLAKEYNSTDNISVIVVVLKPPSEITPPSKPPTMETPELDPFRTNGTLLKDTQGVDEFVIKNVKPEVDDFGPETDVDAPDESDQPWTRPDPIFPDISNLKTSPGVRFSNDYSLDNPFSNNLDDIAEEKSVDEKPEKDQNGKINGDHYENGVLNQKDPLHDLLENVTQSNDFKRDLPDVVNVDSETASIPSAIESFATDFNIGQASQDSSRNLLDNFEAVSNAHFDDFTFDKPSDVPKEAEISKFAATDLFGATETKQFNSSSNPLFDFNGFNDQPNQTTAEIHSNVSPVGVFDDFITSKATEHAQDVQNDNPFLDQDCSQPVESNPFERSTPDVPDETQTPPVVNIIGAGGVVQLEELKSLVAASDNEDGFPQDTHPLAPAVPWDLMEEASNTALPPSSSPCDSPMKPQPADGELVVDDGLDGDESEDDQWNYFKADQKENHKEDLVETHIDNMNSPLNPDAQEWVPVPAVPAGPQTPIKAIPNSLRDDFEVSSPKWDNMDAVEVPDEDAFMKDVVTKPGDVTLDPDVEPFQMPSRRSLNMDGVTPLDDEPVKEQSPVIDIPIQSSPVPEILETLPTPEPLQEPTNEPTLIPEAVSDVYVAPDVQVSSSVSFSPEPITPTPEPEVIAPTPEPVPEEPRGLALAMDMTSSFIDPSTMGGDVIADDFTSQVSPLVEDQREVDEVVSKVEETLANKIEEFTPISRVEEKGFVDDLVPHVEDKTQSLLDEFPSVPQVSPLAEEKCEKHLADSTTLESAVIPEITKESTPLVEVFGEVAAVPDKTEDQVLEKLQVGPAGDQITKDVENMSITEKVGVAASAAVAGTVLAAVVKEKTSAPAKPTKKVSPVSKPTAPSPRTARTTTAVEKSPAPKPAPTKAVAAPKPAVKSTVSPRAPLATTRTRVGSAPVNGVANANLKPAAKTTTTTTTSATRTTASTKPKVPTPQTNGVAKSETKAAPKPAVKSTIPPRPASTAAATRPRVASANAGIPNGALKTVNGVAKKPTEKAAPSDKESIAKKTTLTNRVPLAPAKTAPRPTTAPKTTSAAPKTAVPAAPRPTATKPLPARLSSARPTTASASAATKSKTVAATTKKTTPVAKTNGVTNESKTDPKTVSNGMPVMAQE